MEKSQQETNRKLHLLIPGRHILHTKFLEEFLWEILISPVKKMELYGSVTLPEDAKISDVIFAVTSANQANSRYNPLPFHLRAVGIDRFFDPYRRGIRSKGRIVGIPHFPPTDRYADLLLKEIEAESGIVLTPENAIILCSTEALIEMFAQKGFGILTGEYDMHAHAYLRKIPGDILREITASPDWHEDYEINQHISRPTLGYWKDYPEAIETMRNIWNEPLLTESGSLTEQRNYSVYVAGMNDEKVLSIKYDDIKNFIVPGKIADEGCADGALLTKITRDFPDSDHFGIEITSELYTRCKEQERMGAFGGAFVFFHQKNLLNPIFAPNSINTTICNSTTHEIYSYNEGIESLRKYLRLKYEQTAPGGHLIIRDVVGPENKNDLVWMRLSQTDGINQNIDIQQCPLPEEPRERKIFLESLSTYARFYYFAHWYLKEMRSKHQLSTNDAINYSHKVIDGQCYIVLSRKNASEFISKKDYTDNFLSEMNEQFAFLSFSEWKQELTAAGFSVVENPNEPERSSRTYLSDWIVKNRYQNSVDLFTTEQGKLTKSVYPPTNMILVGRK